MRLLSWRILDRFLLLSVLVGRWAGEADDLLVVVASRARLEDAFDWYDVVAGRFAGTFKIKTRHQSCPLFKCAGPTTIEQLFRDMKSKISNNWESKQNFIQLSFATLVTFYIPCLYVYSLSTEGNCVSFPTFQ